MMGNTLCNAHYMIYENFQIISKYVLTQLTYLRTYMAKVMKTVRLGKTHFGFYSHDEENVNIQ